MSSHRTCTTNTPRGTLLCKSACHTMFFSKFFLHKGSLVFACGGCSSKWGTPQGPVLYPMLFFFFEKEAIKEGLCTHPPVLILIALPKFLSHSSTPFCSNIEHLHWQLLKKEKHHGWLENPQTASTFFYNRRQTISALSIAVIQESMRQHAWF